MKKLFLFILIITFSIFNAYAWGDLKKQKLTYNFIIWKVWDVSIKILEKNPYYSLEAWEDKRKYYFFDLENYKYFTQNWDETNLINKWVHIYNNEFDLDFLSGEYTKWLWYRPQKWDFIISIYNNNTYDDKETYNLYLKNNILKNNYINSNISRVINCNNFSSDFLLYLWESVSVPYNLYKTEDEKLKIQNDIIKKVINKSWVCKTNDNVSQQISKDNKLVLNNVNEKSKNNYIFYFLWIITLLLIVYYTKNLKKK